MITLLTPRDPNFVGEVPHFVRDDPACGFTRFWALDVLWSLEPCGLHLVTQTFLMPMRLHAFAALVLGNF